MTETIGLAVRRLGISTATLRSWERDGLIPKPSRSSDGRRQYSQELIAIIRDVAERRRSERGAA